MRPVVLCVLCLFSSCSSCSRSTSSGTETDKFALWQQASFFRGATIHPYVPYGEPEGRTYMAEADFQALRDAGANVVALNYPGPYGVDAPYALDPTALQYLDDAIAWARRVGLYIIIHFRNGPGKSEASFVGGQDETLWYSAEAQTKWVEMWQFVAQRYRDYAEIIGYNLMVEPHPDLPKVQAALPATVWNTLAIRITNGIRAVDAQTPIIVSAVTYANPVAFPELEPTGDGRTIYSFHLYEPFQFTHQGLAWAGTGDVAGLVYPGRIPSDLYETTQYWDRTLLETFLGTVKTFQSQHAVPIYVGEFGCNRTVNSCQPYFSDVLSIFEASGWHYTIFNWRDGDAFDYELGTTGTQRSSDTEYMRLFRTQWVKNHHVNQ